MPSLIETLRLDCIELELQGRPPREIRLNRSLSNERISLSWPGAEGTLSIDRHGNAIRLRLHLQTKERLGHLMMQLGVSSAPERIFCNGYNDWTGSRNYRSDERPGSIITPARWLLQYMSDIPIIEKRLRTGRGALRSHELTVLHNKRNVLFLGSLSDRNAFTCFEFEDRTIYMHRDVEGWKPGPDECLLDLYIEEAEESDLNTLYQRFFDQKNLPALRAEPATGYTSWYYHYNRISPDDLYAVIDRSAHTGAPIDIIQIDDGFQRRVGDWLDLKPEFGGSLRPVVDRIHEAGFKAGLWLAPFVAESRSTIMRQHPDWIARDRRGRPIRAGFNPLWSYWFYALDLQNEEVREYLHMVFQVVLTEWNFDLLKLDFLYAAALQEPRNMSRAQLLADGVDLIHRATGWKPGQPFKPDRSNGPLLLGCGIPLSAAEGRFDYCRIGSDVKESWEDPLLKAVNYQERVSTYNSLISTINRHHYNGRAFWNDPDVFYLRHGFRALKESEKTDPLPMSREEKATLLLLNHALGGLIFTSDPIHTYNEEEQATYARCFPHLHHRIDHVKEEDGLYSIRFSCEMRDRPLNYVILANLRDSEASIDLPEGLWFRSCLHGKSVTDMPDASWIMSGQVSLAPHHSLCLQQVTELAGTTGHIFPAGDLLSIRLEDASESAIEFRPQNMAKQAFLVVEADSALARQAELKQRFESHGRQFAVIAC